MSMMEAAILSIQAGAVTSLNASGTGEWWDRGWTTGFYKPTVTTPVWLAYGGLRGDQQADRLHHGGVDKAVCVYPAEHYPYWREKLSLSPMEPGAFGENFTTRGLLEDRVCIGDIYAAGEVRVQVSQPRQPCWKLARRWRIKNLTAQVEETGFTGFYFRVLQHGWVEQGQKLTLLERPFPEFTLAHANRIMHHDTDNLDGARKLAGCPVLSASWKDSLWARSERPQGDVTAQRTEQP